MCQAEYRDGFAECSDCHVALVADKATARAASRRLWKGNKQASLDKVLAVLDDLKIPACFKEIVNATPRVSVLGISIGLNSTTFEYEVWVFRGDLEKAKRAIQNIL